MTARADDGGWVYPSAYGASHNGLTKREAYAIAALTGLLARLGMANDAAMAAQESFEIADAMIAASKEGARPILKEEWELAVAQHKLAEAAERIAA